MYLLNSAFKHCKSKLRIRYTVDSCHFGKCDVYPKGLIWKIMVKTLNVTFKECQALISILLSENSKPDDNFTQHMNILHEKFDSHFSIYSLTQLPNFKLYFSKKKLI